MPLVKPSPPTASDTVCPGRITDGIESSAKSDVAPGDAPTHFGFNCTGAPASLISRLPYTLPFSITSGAPGANWVGNDVIFAPRQTPVRLRGSTGPSSGSA